MTKEEVIAYGGQVKCIFEGVLGRELHDDDHYFVELHHICSRWPDHPDWKEYEKMVMVAVEIMKL